MHKLHQEIARLHALASQSHRTASEHNEKGVSATGNWHAERAEQYANRAYELSKEAHNKSGRLGTL